MKKILLGILILSMIAFPASALEYTAPTAPQSAEEYMPEENVSFSAGIKYIITQAICHLQPNIAEASKICLSLVAIIMLSSVLKGFSGKAQHTVDLVTTLAIATVLVGSANSMINLGIRTVQEITEYGKLLLPVMTAALAAQGGSVSSGALYAGTAIFNTVLSLLMSKLIVPLLYIYLILCISHRAIGEDMLKNFKDCVHWVITWGIKILLYLFTGYLGITGVVSGAADAAAIKATKIAITGAVPVVGGILSDASESILASMSVVKSTAGIYGLLAIGAIWIGPFIQIGTHYLILKLTAAVCGAFGTKETVDMINDFSGIMGILVAMTGTASLLFLVSIVCFMKGVG